VVFNATFNNVSAISWRSVLLVEETRVPEENHRPASSHWQILLHNVVSPMHKNESFEFKRNFYCTKNKNNKKIPMSTLFVINNNSTKCMTELNWFIVPSIHKLFIILPLLFKKDCMMKEFSDLEDTLPHTKHP
jgi:hypothetical protein